MGVIGVIVLICSLLYDKFIKPKVDQKQSEEYHADLRRRGLE